jgi:hypothetical protein
MTGAVAALMLAATARADVTNIVRLTLTASIQNTSSENGAIVTTLAPVKKTVTTTQLLGYLAQAVWGTPSFPPGAKLALVTSSPTDGYFVVIDPQYNVLADVSYIMSFSAGTVVYSGKQDFYGNAAPTLKGLEIVRIDYDDTYDGGSIQFSVRGLLSGSVSQGTTTVTQSATVANVTGEGNYQSIPLVVSGSMTFKGTAKLY